MKHETQKFLNFIDQEIHLESLSIEKWKEYLRRLPHIYNGDITFRLLFDWHWALDLCFGRASYKNPSACTEVPIYSKQIQLIKTIGFCLHNLDYQYRELILFHARSDLRGKSLLEIGGSLPNDLLFEYLGVESYINIESPDYIEAKSKAYSTKHGKHVRKQTIFCDAEEIHKKSIPNQSITSFRLHALSIYMDFPQH